MAIQPKPKTAAAAPLTVPPASRAADAFINSAPDARAPARRVRGRKEQISLTLKPELIDQVDLAAEAMGQSRAAWISGAIYRALQQQT